MFSVYNDPIKKRSYQRSILKKPVRGTLVDAICAEKTSNKHLPNKIFSFINGPIFYEVSQKVKTLISLTHDPRQQHLQKITASGETPVMSEIERKAISRIKIASTACGLTVMGVWIHPLLLLFAAPLFIYTLGVNYQDGLIALKNERTFKSDLLSPLSSTALLLNGALLSASVVACISSFVRYFVIKTEDHSQKSLVNLFGEQTHSVWILKENVEVEVSLEQVQMGDIVIIGTGQNIPIDGTITSGIASIDQHMLTGEAQPIEMGPEDSVLAATIVLSGKIEVCVTKTGENTVAAKIGHALNQTTDYRNVVKLRADEYSSRMVAPMLGISCLSLLVGGLDSFAGLLMSTPAYKMRYLAPASLLNYLNIAAREGILIKDGRALELITEVDTVIFDKTGTLTLEQPHVSNIYICSNFTEDELLALTATAEHRQSHPIAQAILAAAHERQLELYPVDDAHYEIGYGIQVIVNGQKIHVGSERYMKMSNIAIPDDIQARQERYLRQGHSIIMVAINDDLAGIIELQPTVRPETKQIIHHLRQRNLDVVIISGDRIEPTTHLAQELGVNRYFAQVLPADKAQLVEQLENEGRSVCFIGDGINDAIALKQATVSISLQGATSVATDTAQIVLMDTNLTQLVYLFEIGQKFNVDIKNCLKLTTIPMWACIGGTALLGWSFVASYIINTSILFGGFAYVMWPLLEHAKRKKSPLSAHKIT